MSDVRTRWLLVLVAAGAALVWAASPELRWPARAFMTFLLVPLPFLLVLQARHVESPELLPRTAIYASSAIALWLLAATTAVVARTGGFGPAALGLRPPLSWTAQLLWATALTAAGVGIMFAARALGIRESGTLVHLLPKTGRERVAFAGLSVTAGVCEELVFRGFLLAALLAASGSLTLALLVSSFAFGVVHAYQDPGGVARATLLGLLLAIPVVLTGSIAAPVLAHTAIDLIGGLWLGERLTR